MVRPRWRAGWPLFPLLEQDLAWGPTSKYRRPPGLRRAASPDRPSRRLRERRNAGDVLADDQPLDIVRAFVRVHRFEVVHVAHHTVIIHDPVRAQQFARAPR